MRRFIAALAFLLMLSLPGFAQSPGAAASGGKVVTDSAAERALTEGDVTAMDIATGSLSDLAQMCKDRGLSEGGTKEQLQQRLYDATKTKAPVDFQGKGSTTGKIITIQSARNTEYFTLTDVDENYTRLTGDVVITLKDKDSTYTIKAWQVLYNKSRDTITASGNVSFVKVENGNTESFQGDYISVDLNDWQSIFKNAVFEKQGAAPSGTSSTSSSGTASSSSSTSNSTASPSGDDNTFAFTGDILSRDAEGTTILNHGTISRPKGTPDSYWSIQASKIWLLPGNDWALSNAVLKVGNIPVFYIPFLLYPTDEIIFHPVLGIRQRAGVYLQTTTYLLGQAKTETSSESSLTNIMGSSSTGPKTRHGIFLRQSNSTGKTTQTNGTSLAILADIYTNLGFYAGVNMTLPSEGIFKGMNFAAAGALSRDVFNDKYSLNGISNWSPYDNDGKEYWNPFRYSLETSGSFAGAWGNLGWNFNAYSDPYIKNDFSDRKEGATWIDMALTALKGGDDFANTDINSTTNTTVNAITSYDEKLSGSFTPPVTILSPYVSSFSLSNLSTDLSYSATTTMNPSLTGQRAIINSGIPTDPNYYIFVPNKWNLFSVTGSIAGTPLTINPALTNASDKDKPVSAASEKAGFTSVLGGIGQPVAPWVLNNKAGGANAGEKDSDIASLVPPALSQTFTLPKAIGLPSLAFSYNLTPSGTADMTYNNPTWLESKDIDYSDISSILYTFRGSGSISAALTDPSSGLYNATTTLSTTGTLSNYWYTNNKIDPTTGKGGDDSVSVASRENTWYNNKNSAYAASNFDTEVKFTNTVNPFYWSNIFNTTSISYNIQSLVAKSQYDATSVTKLGDKPHYKIIWPKWDKKSISTHNLGMNLGATVWGQNQSLNFTYNLPPLDGSISATATANAWISTTTFNASWTKKLPPGRPSTGIDEEDDKFKKWLPNPYTFSEKLAPYVGYSITTSATYDSQKLAGKTYNLTPGNSDPFVIARNGRPIGQWTAFNMTLTVPTFTFTYTMAWQQPYKLVDGVGWCSQYVSADGSGLYYNTNGKVISSSEHPMNTGDQPFYKFAPSSLSFAWTPTINIDPLFGRTGDTFSLGLNTSLTLDLQRFTNSKLDFTLKLTMKITRYLDLTFATSSENASLIRYVPGHLGVALPPGTETNFFTDLFNSLAVGDKQKQQSSGFKLKSLSLTTTHYLGDWTANLGLTMSPYLDTTGKNSSDYKWRFGTTINFSVQWTPIVELKVNGQYDSKDDTMQIK